MIENTFGINIVPENDDERIIALARYQIMDTPSEASFDNIAGLCTRIFNVPISLVSLVDTDRVFFKANAGMGKAKEANRGKSLCALAILDTEVTVFEDALKEPCLMANPNVIGDFGLRFYAGAPLITHDGFLIGTLCIIDQQPRMFSTQQQKILAGMAQAVMDQIELRLVAMNEISDRQLLVDQLNNHQEEMQAMNEELSTTNEELQATQEHLIAINEDLSVSESRFRNIIQQSPVAIATLKGKDLIVECANDMILKIWGKDQSVIGKPLQLALPELEGQPFLDILDEVFHSRKPYFGNEAKLSVSQDGQPKELYVNFVYQPVQLSGEVEDIIIVANDVTEQVNARKTIAEGSHRLELALDAGSLGSYDVDLDTGIMFCTPQCKQNFGLPADATFNFTDLLNCILPEYQEMVQQKVSYAIANNTVYHAEYEAYWPDRSRHWISAHGKPWSDEEEPGNRMIGVTIDITERKLFEHRKDDFLSIASHELKTPITSLKASLQLLDRIKAKETSDMHIKLIEQSNRSMEKMSLLVDDLLNVNRMTEGQLKLEKTTFTIAEMLHLCCNHVRVAGTHELIIEGDDQLQVHADEHRIDQVVVNFVNNAVKYAPGAREIFMKIESVADCAKLSVTDRGPGIPEEILPHLFERYYRVNHASKNYTGLGLGLYICAEIIKKHGGQIGAESTLGVGSTFWFTIPLGLS